MDSIEAILVDFDGTLVNTESANAKAYASSLQSYGFKVSEKALIEYCTGRHWSKFLPEILKDQYNEDIGLKIAKDKKVIYPQFYDEIEINAPLLKLLKHFAGLPKALVTNASRESVAPILDLFNMGSFFKIIICQEDVADPKPSPECYLRALSLLKVNGHNCLAIEDSKTGVLAAKSAGIPTIKVSPFTD
jgi:HAD superfamily hydrolase (TIGR01509 family)